MGPVKCPPRSRAIAQKLTPISARPQHAVSQNSQNSQHAERAFADLRHWNTPPHGGHFMAHEELELVADELRGFFRTLRSR
ncbi:hypothetical protein QMK19_03040 [Streptomyces sp. H10-C2]|uniref:hypothetical protein n=1 Tax=unclassified Streptomyces TaxID=2593676 RepID=UPI0024BA106A|nr:MULTISPECIES: hypothetical protein [unclassified Streptomyces]MDJ0342161.1 hypothetical protein [Streptomyces sp. PH10-H1]MDJ0368675.1 hypothetical protein [Streptomyces sp. H10-C2]